MKNDTEPPHPIDTDDPNDGFEQMARKAGAALRRPAPSDGVARLRSARRRQQIVRTSLAAGASAIVIVVGLVVLNRPSENTAPTDSPEASTTLAPATTTTSSATSSTTTTTIPAAANLAYTLTGIDGLAATGDPAVNDSAGGPSSLVSAWTGPNGITESFIALTEVRGSTGATEPEGDNTSVSIDVPDGRGYLVTDNGADGKPMTLHSATRLMWWRDDGRLWVVSNYEVTPERLTQLTLAIQPGSGLPYVIPSAGTTFVGFNTSESYESVRQDWSLDGAFLELAVTSGGLAQQLADVAAVSVVERTIAGAAGYAITLSNAQVNLMWPTANADHWGSLIVAAPLVPRLDEIVAAITPT